ncbi:LemA family protein [Chitinophaga sp. Cy-1792]|uniref:LemA family protein n=1 Tax=Chitinophaga sp. Cy-1792 TaxID=2608339 RepID=UPI0014236CE2|nr:LemA family protein [Chitinophaga sp. Cy-1792]NIG54500.1 LemA family protein [Chitinophaga sp. Cy-1792]
MGTALLIASLLAIFSADYYKKLLRIKRAADHATECINAVIERRYDMIPKLVNAVKSYMTYENDVLNKLMTMRTKGLSDNTSEAETLIINSRITCAFKHTLTAMESYPELIEQDNFPSLRERCIDMDDYILASGRFYNNAVIAYNHHIKSFPGNLIALLTGYKSKPLLDVTEEETRTTTVRVLFYHQL